MRSSDHPTSWGEFYPFIPMYPEWIGWGVDSNYWYTKIEDNKGYAYKISSKRPMSTTLIIYEVNGDPYENSRKLIEISIKDIIKDELTYREQDEYIKKHIEEIIMMSLL